MHVYIFIYMCFLCIYVCAHMCRYIWAYVVSMCAYAYVCVYVCLHVHVSIDLLLWSDIPFPSEVDFEEWLVVQGGLKRVHSLVPVTQHCWTKQSAFPSSRKGVGRLLFATQGSLYVEGRDESRKKPENKRYMKNKCSCRVTVERTHREKEKVAFESERGNRWFFRSGVPVVQLRTSWSVHVYA